jgi:copper resistance protein C
MQKLFLVLGTVTILGVALAHSTVKTATPADHAHVTVAPKTVTVGFDEKFAVKNAVFKVYYLSMQSMMKNGKPLNPGQMDDVAEAATNKYLNAKDTSARVDTGMQKTAATTTKVVINLKPGLKPGVYVTMWKLKAADGDTVTGFIHFHFDGKM